MNIDFNTHRWRAVKQNYRRWWNGNLERPLIHATLHGHAPQRAKPDMPWLEQEMYRGINDMKAKGKVQMKMTRLVGISTLTVVAGLMGAISCGAQIPQPVPGVILPLDRTAYFIGETVPLALAGGGACKLEAVNARGRTLLYEGNPDAVWLDTSRLAPGDYTLELKDARDRLIIKYYYTII